MITKGIILSKIVSSNKYLVRIPYLESAGMPQSKCEAILSITPGVTESLAPDDVVLVGFEDHLASKPVIIGKLFTGEEKARGNALFSDLTVEHSVSLPFNTKIGDIDIYEKIRELTNQAAFADSSGGGGGGEIGDILTRLAAVEDKVSVLEGKVETLEGKVETLEEEQVGMLNFLG